MNGKTKKPAFDAAQWGAPSIEAECEAEDESEEVDGAAVEEEGEKVSSRAEEEAELLMLNDDDEENEDEDKRWYCDAAAEFTDSIFSENSLWNVCALCKSDFNSNLRTKFNDVGSKVRPSESKPRTRRELSVIFSIHARASCTSSSALEGECAKRKLRARQKRARV